MTRKRSLVRIQYLPPKKLSFRQLFFIIRPGPFMLQYLRIQNLALLEEVALDLEPGFIAVTGETGAGKSILLGALQLLAGARADKSVIRQGAEVCEIEAALFAEDSAPVHSLLRELELPPCEEGCLLLKRTLPRAKMPRVFVNGSLTTLGNLQRLSECWIDFHGPGEPQRLFKPEAQLELLDLFAGHDDVLAAYREHYREWRQLLADKDALLNETALSPDEADFLRQQIVRIDDCVGSREDVEALERDFLKVSRGQELIALSRRLSDGLTGEGEVLDRLSELQRVGRELEEADPSRESLVSRLRSLSIETEDLAREFEMVAESFDLDPAEAEAIQNRMNEWFDIKRRYGSSVDAVLRERAAMAQRLERQRDIKGCLERLEGQIGVAEGNLRKEAARLRKGREKAAEKLSREVRQSLPSLGFQKSGFSVEIVGEAALKRHGDCRCEFRFSPNAGQELMPLNKIASSGEIARVMLAIKTILAEVDDIPVLVFDEVDANVGGEIGRSVGERLAGLSGRHQVFCVTHLPQVAGLAESHYLVDKSQKGKKTRVTIAPLHGRRDARLGELARMLGDRKAKSALAHAEELLRV
jgi:DNA repair protein RecN (Recombination protein N)